MSRPPAGFFLACLLFLLTVTAFAASPPLWPSLLLAESDKDHIDHVVHDQVDWTYNLDGPLKDVQAQPDGSFLVSGGTQQVSLVKRDWKSFKTVWDWGRVDTGRVESAAAADFDVNGHPTLVVAADSKNNRLFLAEARSFGVKIRWEYKLPAAPRSVRLCPDTGNFMVLLQNGTLHEIHFQEDKEVWTLGPADGFKGLRDAARDPWAHTYLADAVRGSITCLDARRHSLWETHLPFAPGKPQDMTLSLFRKNGKRLVLAAVRFSDNGSKSPNVIYLLNAETGKVIEWTDRQAKGAYPVFFKAIPAQPSYYRKQ